jgi:uncharacterized protein (TIGR00255 family)
MLLSMTGFGRATAELDGLAATVELRSVNNRFCEVVVRSPRELSRWESDIVNIVKKSFARGRISALVQVDYPADAGAHVSIDTAAAKRYVKILKDLRKAAGVKDQPRLEHLLSFPGVMQTAESTKKEDDVWRVAQAALEAAIEGLAEMRAKEGATLARELELRISEIEKSVVVVDERAPIRVEEARQRLRDRLAEVMSDDRINPDRLELELVLIADKLEITEEVVRLRSHIEQFREALASRKPTGRKLNFIYQEMNREVNTIGSKANDAEVTRAVVLMKEALEKIREQVENVE